MSENSDSIRDESDDEPCESDCECCDCPFPFLTLPREIQLKVLREIPDYWTYISLRQTSSEINELCLVDEEIILVNLRKRLITPFYDYYDFHVSLHLPERAVKQPPSTGWPEITLENFRPFGKSDLAIEVLRHLPYVENLEYRDNEYNIDRQSNVIDYSAWKPGDEYPGKIMEDYFDEKPISKHKIAITSGYESCGVTFLLDTLTGCVYEEILRCNAGVWDEPVEDYFESKKEEFQSLDRVFSPGFDTMGGLTDQKYPYDAEKMEKQGEPRSPAKYFMGTDEDGLWIRHLYRKFGWPSPAWKKEEGIQAIKDFAARRVQEHIRYEQDLEMQRRLFDAQRQLHTAGQ
ncbi:hypothetical protein GCG54_00000438 [Colletotrichum gloeosporioides]|uniref:F-box domain-containing protein n=1 Tax=Colletotrichum gloeosporioides TaxID=474922 RepID=A0A8H4FQ72_COLGL|nr:uncharacterized protein GCG54_00000438 [Colletotrichum gloeosporioides]KAF3810392.1 hypothetical protein GCG54_00000438 [Colletotrichum gloeosporioides]